MNATYANDGENIACDICGSRMVRRSGSFGEFMGCSSFSTTNCRGRQRVPRDQEVINKSVMAFAEDGDELDPEKLHTAQQLLKYYHFCSKASLRAGGFENAFQTSPEVIDLPANFWEKVYENDDTFSVIDEKGHDVYRVHKQDVRKNPVIVGSLFIVGKIYKAYKGKDGTMRQSITKICAPLLYSPATLVPGEGNGFEIEVDEYLPQLNHRLLDKVLQLDSRASKIYSDMDLEEFNDQVPFFPLQIEDTKNFLDYLKGHFNISELDIPFIEEFKETDIKEESASEELRIIPAHGVLIGKEIDHLTVVGELERLSGWKNFGDTALEHSFFPENDEISFSTGDLDEESSLDEVFSEPLFSHEFEAFELSDTQKAIKDAVRQEPLVTVTGPPGTGKSHTASAIALDFVFANKTVLFSSNTQEAISVLVKKLKEYGGDFIVAESGNNKAQRVLADLLSNLVGPNGLKNIPTKDDLNEIKNQHDEVLIKYAEKVVELDEQLTLNSEKSSLDVEKKEIEEEGIDLSDDISADPEKIKSLLNKGENYINGNFLKSFLGKRAIQKAREALNSEEEDLSVLERQSRLYELQTDIHMIDNELLPHFDKLFHELQELNETRYEIAANWINKNRIYRLDKLLNNQSNKRAITYLIKALKTRELDLKAELLAKVPYELLLAIFPVWASKDNFISNILPLKPKMFDCVIIDEASFCRANSAIPALYRANHAVVIGDPKQLRPIYARLANRLKKTALTQSGLDNVLAAEYDFQMKTIFDIAVNKVKRSYWFMLDEHFRSSPSIIGFSKKNFYDNGIKIMTGRPTNGPKSSMEVINVNGIEDPVTKINSEEIKEILNAIKREIANDVNCTIAVVTPYKEQRNYIEKTILKNFTQSQIERHELVGRTVYQMQGDERDIVILSTCFDKGVNPGRLRYFQGTLDNESSKGVFNVAITRARKKQIIITSVETQDLPAGLYKEYLEYIESLEEPTVDINSIPYKGEQQVYSELIDLGYKTFYQFESCGYKIDFVITDGIKCLAIEYDGPLHFNEDGTYVDEDIQRHLTLKRAGWDIYRITYDKWEKDPASCLSDINSYFLDSYEEKAS
tara:strand:+ start:1783 stop:5043 length:3261 start_codon:yes stop_codon:yes gene_type:complete